MKINITIDSENKVFRKGQLTYKKAIEKLEDVLIVEHLRLCNNNILRASKSLGIHRNTLAVKISRIKATNEYKYVNKKLHLIN